MTIVDHVSSEKKLIFAVVEADTAARVTRHVEHSQLSVPQVDDITLTVKNGNKCNKLCSLIYCLAVIKAAVEHRAHF